MRPILAAAVVMTLAGATSLTARGLADATLSPAGDGWRLTGRLVIQGPLFLEAEAVYGSAWEKPDSIVEARAPRAADSGWMGRAAAPRPAPPPRAATASPRLPLPPPAATETSHIHGKLAPLLIPLEGVGNVRLVKDCDIRMVQQRVLPPELSVPMVFSVQVKDAQWRFRYNARREGFVPGESEDEVSRPILAAWRKRDAAGVAATEVGVAIRGLLTRWAPIATRTQLSVDQVWVIENGSKKRKLERTKDLIRLPGTPRRLDVEFQVSRRDWRALPGAVEDLKTRPADGFETTTPGPGWLSPAAVRELDRSGTALLSTEPQDARRLSVQFSLPGENVVATKLSLAWRWGRKQEAWLDTGKPAGTSLPSASDHTTRRSALVTRLLESYSADDGFFHEPYGRPANFDNEALANARPAVFEALERRATTPESEALRAVFPLTAGEQRRPDASQAVAGLRRELMALEGTGWSRTAAAAAAKLAKLLGPETRASIRILADSQLDALAQRLAISATPRMLYALGKGGQHARWGEDTAGAWEGNLWGAFALARARTGRSPSPWSQELQIVAARLAQLGGPAEGVALRSNQVRALRFVAEQLADPLLEALFRQLADQAWENARKDSRLTTEQILRLLGTMDPRDG